MYDRVLVPVAETEGIDRVVDHAVGVAAPHDATVHVLHVVDRRLYLAADEDEQADVLADLEARGDEALAAARTRFEEAGVAVETERREGVPYREIMAYAADTDADIVVMGTHGRSGREKRVNLGSTAERVVRESDRPVLVVDVGEA